MSNKHLFIVCMNNGGSTLLHHYLSECNSVVALPRKSDQKQLTRDDAITGAGPATSSEGHNHAKGAMPHPRRQGVLGIWTEKPDLISNDKNYDWEMVKKRWFEAWEVSAGKPLENMVLLEKSPPNVIRAGLLQRHFPNSYFILMVRDPYALSEGLRRRLGYKIERCAAHWGESMRFQINNLKILNNVVWMKYADLCDNQKLVKEKIKKLLPELEDLSFGGKLSGHHSMYGKKAMTIRNLNSNQIKNLSRNDIIRINGVLHKYEKELIFFGYKMRA